jgi:outer membrane protein assembly factor BamB
LAHDARSGAERWELRDARAVVGTRDTLITAAPGPPFAYTGRDLFTSIPKWSVAVPYYSGILVNRDTIVLQASELTAIDSTSGTTRWTSDYPSIFPTRYPDDALGPTFRTYIGDSALIVAGGCALTSAN